MNHKTDAPILRCAIYARSATHSPPETSNSSVHAQRAACQENLRGKPGWEAKPLTYMDIGFSGATLDRPALERLLLDIDAGEVDLVVVHAVKCLTRSLLDFRTLMDRFEKAGVELVIVGDRPAAPPDAPSAAEHDKPPEKTS